MKNRQPFVASVFRAVKKKKQREPRSTQDLARNMRPVSKRGKKYNQCTCEKHVTLVRAGSRMGLKVRKSGHQTPTCNLFGKIAAKRVE